MYIYKKNDVISKKNRQLLKLDFYEPDRPLKYQVNYILSFIEGSQHTTNFIILPSFETIQISE